MGSRAGSCRSCILATCKWRRGALPPTALHLATLIPMPIPTPTLPPHSSSPSSCFSAQPSSYVSRTTVFEPVYSSHEHQLTVNLLPGNTPGTPPCSTRSGSPTSFLSASLS
jgi:hypothetical protein